MTDAEEVISKDGTKLHIRRWLPLGPRSAVVVLVHGLKAHSGLYEWPASEMARAGFAVYALDLRGHGKSGEDEDFSRDRAFVEQMKTDPLLSRQGYPAQTIAELARADERLHTELARITIPVLVLHGTDDHVTLPSGSKLFGEIGGSQDKTLTLYQGHYHDLLNDLGKERVLGDVIDWIERHLVLRAA